MNPGLAPLIAAGAPGVPFADQALIDCAVPDGQLSQAIECALASAWPLPDGATDGQVRLAIWRPVSATPTVFLGTTPQALAWLDNPAPPDLADFPTPGTDLVVDIVRAARRLGTPRIALVPMPLAPLIPGDGGGTARSRDLATGEARAHGCFLPEAGVTGTLSLDDCTGRAWWPSLTTALQALERHFRDAAEVGFTVQGGQLLILAARPMPRDPAGDCVMAAVLVAEGKLLPAEALARVPATRFAAAARPPSAVAPDSAIGRGLGVSPGIASGRATFGVAQAMERRRRGEAVVLIRAETRPEDLPALLAAAAVVTARGGRTSHAAVVARSAGRPCVVGVANALIDADRGVLTVNGVEVADGDLITVDGSNGLISPGADPTAPADPGPMAGWASDRLLSIADAQRRLLVLGNVDTPADAALARRAGCAGIGLCRTEHMFLGDRQPMLAEILLGAYDSTAREALGELHRLQRADFTALLTEMDGLPVTVRLLDPPRHEFLPDRTDISVRAALAAERGEPTRALERLLIAVERKTERNPMLGVRGIRLGVVSPWLYEMQIAALLEASAERIHAGGDPRPRLLIPMVATATELLPVLAFARHTLDELRSLAGPGLSLPIGVMIETPRAALTAGELAVVADFFSFGTNDLTQLVWGLSRDDTDMAVLMPYQDLRLIDASPFERLDRAGVGELVRLAVQAGRMVKPTMLMGVCGEHAADPDSIRAFHEWGLDYLSCTWQDAPIARYSAGYAACSPASEGGYEASGFS
jgi:pyruvate,orthophosphate dikinase